MKNTFFVQLLLIVSLLFAFLPSKDATAISNAAETKQITLSGDQVLTPSTWAVLFPSIAKGIKGFSLFSSAPLAIEVGAASASAAANAEAAQVLIPPALSSVGAPGAVYYPLALSYGSRISIRAKSSSGTTITSGEVDMTVFYN